MHLENAQTFSYRTKALDSAQLQQTLEGDCAPVFECIIGQEYIGDVWAWSGDEAVVFNATIMLQFVGVMHQHTEWEKTYGENDGPGWIEDGVARKGDIICTAYFDDLTEALDHLMGMSKHLLAQIYDDPELKNISV